jgi:hypothetical protein
VIVFDTTVLVYALGSDHPAREPSRRLIEAAGERLIAATTTPEVIQQFVHVFARRRTRAEAVRHARRYVTLFSPLRTVETRDLDLALRLFEDHSDLDSSDALLAAVAVNRDAEALVSSDRAFAGIRRLRHVDPTGPELDKLLV